MKQLNKVLQSLVVIFALVIQLVPFQSAQAATGTINATNKWAWSENIGWINFDATSSNVVINDTSITGYAWSANYGWINLNPPGAGVTNNTNGVLGGSAWGENTGFISFSGVTIDSNGFFQGNASGTVTGSISFNCANTSSCGSSDFKVETDWLPSGTTDQGSSPQKQQAQQQQEQQAPDPEPEPEPEPEPVEEPIEEPPVEDPTEEPIEEPVEEPVEEPAPVDPQPEPEPVDENLPDQEQEEAPGDNQPPPPPEPPTQEESSNIETILDTIIEQEVQEIGGDSGEERSRIRTESQSDGRSFNIEVIDGDEPELSISGLASTDQNRIEFTGSTSEPNSTVTLIFNNSVTVVVTSDAEGFWQTFVNAEQLGISPGQTAAVSIEAIASKETLVSDRVNVGEVILDLSLNGDVVGEFESIVEEGATLTAINSIAEATIDLIEEQEVVIQQTLAVGAPVILVSSAPLWGYLPYLPTLLYHLVTYLIGLIGRRKQDGEKLYGQVYDSITKKPLGLAVLRVYRVAEGARQLVATKVTDKLGRYDLLLEPGNYQIEAKKPQYSFPSKIVTSAPDGDHTVIYDHNTGFVSAEGVFSIPDIPIDPVDAKAQWSLANLFKKLWLTLQKAGHFLAVPALFIGAIAGVATVIAVPESIENWILAVLYVFMLALQLRLRSKIEKAWGVVYDLATSAALPLTTIQLIDPEYGKVVANRLTDYQGRFAFLPEPGEYLVKASKEGYEQAEVVESPDKDHAPMSGKVSIQKEGQRIDGDIAMTKL